MAVTEPKVVGNMAGLGYAIYPTTLSGGAATIVTQFSEILSVQASYKAGTATAALTATWTAKTITLAGTGTDTVNVIVFGRL